MDRSANPAFRTEAPFELPLAYVDESGARHRRGGLGPPTPAAAIPPGAACEPPPGYVHESGARPRRGVMRLAAAADEILPMRDPRVQANPAYLSIIILSRVIVKLGSLPDVDTSIVERLFTQDFEYLRRL